MTSRTYSHIAVLKGGLSAEREVSLRSGAAESYQATALAPGLSRKAGLVSKKKSA